MPRILNRHHLAAIATTIALAGGLITTGATQASAAATASSTCSSLPSGRLCATISGTLSHPYVTVSYNKTSGSTIRAQFVICWAFRLGNGAGSGACDYGPTYSMSSGSYNEWTEDLGSGGYVEVTETGEMIVSGQGTFTTPQAQLG